MGALSCADGRYYHEWQLNPEFEEGLAKLNEVEVQSPTKKLRYCTVVERAASKIKIHYVGFDNNHDEWLELGSSRLNFKKYRKYKFVSPAPDISGSDEDPGVPLDNAICQHCGQAKVQHQAKGAMTSLSLAKNRLGAEGAKIIAAVLPECT
jgi:hypothetical protein